MANTVSFGQIVDPEEQAIERRRALAQALMLQSQQPFQQETAGGMTVPRSPMEGFAKIAQSLVSTKLNKDADAKQNEYIAKQGQNVADFVTALSGKAATPGFQTGGNEMGDEPVMQKGTPAIAPDTAKAMALALRTPGLQGQAGSLIEQQSVMGLINRLRGNSGAPTGDAGGAPGAPGAVGATGSSPFANVSPEVMGLTLSSNPGAQKLGAMLQDTTKPIALREGDLVRPNGQGGYSSVYQAPKLEPGIVPQRDANGQVIGAQAIPNYAPAAASIKGAEAGAVSAAQSENELIPVDTATGPKMMTRAQARALANGGAPAAPQAPAVVPSPVQPPAVRPTAGNPPPGAGIVPPQSPVDRMGILKGQLTQAQQLLADPKLNDMDRARAQQDVDGIQTEMRLMGQSNGKPNGLAPNTAPGIALQSDEQKAYGKERAKEFAAQAKTLSDVGQKASGTIGTIRALRTLYADPNVAKGGGAELTSTIKNLASTFGVDVQGVGSEQAIQSVTNKMALDLRSTADGTGMPGAMSDGDRKFLVGMTPGLSKTPQGREAIMQTYERLAVRQTEIAKMATQYEKEHGQLDVGFQQQVQQYSAANPLFADMKLPQTATAPAAPGAHPAGIQSILNKYSRGGATGSF